MDTIFTYNCDDTRNPKRLAGRRWLKPEDNCEEYPSEIAHATYDSALDMYEYF
jgi:hypothetical protein